MLNAYLLTSICPDTCYENDAQDQLRQGEVFSSLAKAQEVAKDEAQADVVWEAKGTEYHGTCEGTHWLIRSFGV